MHTDCLQSLRLKLQKRVRRLNAVDFHAFHHALRHFWGFVQSQPLLVAVLRDLQFRHAAVEQEAALVVGGEARVVDTEDEHAALSLFIIAKCVASEAEDAETKVGFAYGHRTEYAEDMEQFRTLFVEPLYDYLDEHLDEERSILAQLRRFKHKCEWFRRDSLYEEWRNDTGKGEEALAAHLYEFLFDQGIDIVIEPRSESGRADFVSVKIAEEPFVADVKIFNPDSGRGRPYIVKAFHQVYRYALDHNRQFGYLVIFNTSGRDLKLALANQEGPFPFATHNHKTIFFVIVDIFPHEAPASKRGTLECVTLTEEELVREMPQPPG